MSEPLKDGASARVEHLAQCREEEAWDEGHREAWARRTVAAAGKSWSTHLAKFSGAVLPR